MQHESCEWTENKTFVGQCVAYLLSKNAVYFFFFHIKELGMHCLKLEDDITKALQREVEPNGNRAGLL